jgi:hypothetical protein
VLGYNTIDARVIGGEPGRTYRPGTLQRSIDASEPYDVRVVTTEPAMEASRCRRRGKYALPERLLLRLATKSLQGSLLFHRGAEVLTPRRPRFVYAGGEDLIDQQMHTRELIFGHDQ